MNPPVIDTVGLQKIAANQTYQQHRLRQRLLKMDTQPEPIYQGFLADAQSGDPIVWQMIGYCTHLLALFNTAGFGCHEAVRKRYYFEAASLKTTNESDTYQLCGRRVHNYTSRPRQWISWLFCQRAYTTLFIGLLILFFNIPSSLCTRLTPCQQVRPHHKYRLDWQLFFAWAIWFILYTTLTQCSQPLSNWVKRYAEYRYGKIKHVISE